MAWKVLLFTMLLMPIFGSGIAYAQYGPGPNEQRIMQEGIALTKQEAGKQMLTQQAETEKNNQTLLVLAIGIPALATAVIIPLLTKKFWKK